jgi:hypothetical protein
MAKATCKRCGQEGLIWRQSKKGNWYLSDPQKIWQGKTCMVESRLLQFRLLIDAKN